MVNLKGDRQMKTRAIKAIVVLLIALSSGDLYLSFYIVGAYIAAEVASLLFIRMIKHFYTKQLIDSGYFYQN